MKNLFILLFVLSFFAVATTNCSQRVYSTTADTVKLNIEYSAVSKSIIALQADIETVKSKIPIYEAKAQKASARSKESLDESSEQSSKATSGKLKEIRKAESKADDAEEEAEDARDAALKVKNAKKDLTDLMVELAKKQNRIKQLDKQRAIINAK